MQSNHVSRLPFALLLAALLFGVACAGTATTVCEETGRICPDGTKCVAKGTVCALSECGNGVKELTEECDDGANKDGDVINGKRCSADCTSNEECGNGIVDTRIGEVCDKAAVDAGRCSFDCKSDLTCGNGIWDKEDTEEQCDGKDGPPGTACQDCHVIECGNGRVDGDEQCDYNAEGETDCTLLCERPRCGDGVVTGEEACDPKNDETCREDCRGKIGCGDGKKVAGEECDDGNLNPGDKCGPTCLVEACGNNFKDPGEVCDGKNEQGGPCRDDCLSDLRCGNGIKDPLEVCDYADPENGTRCNQECTRLDGCGNGFVELGEQCDPAQGEDAGPSEVSENVASCDKDCTLPVCGDSETNIPAGEDCDPGPAGLTASCTSSCKLSICGDRFINDQARETCDDGPDDSARCNGAAAGVLACRATQCGDGYTNSAATEECEPQDAPDAFDPDSGDSAECNGPNAPAAHQCKPASCGDGYKNAAFGEKCDSGEQDTAACNNGQAAAAAGVACLTPTCGDGYVNTAAQERCEPPSTADSNGDGPSCNGPNGGTKACLDAQCGDGYRNAAAGECGDTVNDTPDCNGSKAGLVNGCKTKACGDGYTHSQEGCDSGGVDSADCNGAICTRSDCGDGYVNRAAGELCDPGVAPDLVNAEGDSPTCNGKSAGSKACQPSECGDGYVNKAAGECGDQATDGPGCNSNRAGGTVGCMPSVCGDGYPHTSEECDSGGVDTKLCNGRTCSEARCGDGYHNPVAEQCEPDSVTKNADGDTASCNGPLAEAASCLPPRCGDGYTNTEAMTGTDPYGDPAAEACDTGAADSEACNGSGGTASKCQLPTCIDARVNRAAGEECDTHTHSDIDEWRVLPLETHPDPDACNPVEAGALACKRAICGDGYTNVANEECDPENLTDENHALCNPATAKGGACTIGICGDGFISGLEQCDPGQDGVQDGADSVNCNGTNAGPLACTRRTCGDSYTNRAIPAEQCDPPSPFCTVRCTNSSCGDMTINPLAGEDCDRDEDGQWPWYCIDSDGPEELRCHRSECGDHYQNPRLESCNPNAKYRLYCPDDCPDGGP